MDQTSVDLNDEHGAADKSDHSLSTKNICSLAGMRDKIRQNGKSGSFSSSTSSGSCSSMDIGGNNFTIEKQDSISFKPANICVKKVPFDTVAGTSCSTGDASPFKVTIPSQDTVLVTGISDRLQVLLHNKLGQTTEKEVLSHRIFCSENDMDIIASVGSCDKLKSRRDTDLASSQQEVSVHQTPIQAKHALHKTTVMQKIGGKYDTCIKLDTGAQRVPQVCEKKMSHSAMKLNPCLKRQARVEGADNHTDIPLPKRFCKSNSDVTTGFGSNRIQSVPTGSLDTPNYTRSFDFNDESIMSSPLMKKKRVTFGNDAHVKRESVL